MLWGSTAVSDLGSAVTYLALPLTAIHLLDAGPREMGWLLALGQLPVPLLGLFVGVWVDRLRRRPLMIAADLGRAALITAIPVAALAGALELSHLYMVALLVGSLTVLFDLGVTSYVPSLVGRPDLLDANSKLQITANLAGMLGRTGGGALVRMLGAPVALLVDAATFLLSALALSRIRDREPRPAPVSRRMGLWREIGEGVRVTFGEPVVASMVVVSTLGAFGGAVQQAVLFLFLTNQLALGPLAIGLITAVAPFGAWLGASLAPRLGIRLGPGPALVLGGLSGALGAGLVALAGVAPFRTLPTLVVAQALGGLGLALYSVNQISLRQALIPDEVLGRVNATRRVFVFGAIPLGAVLGGGMGEALGLRTTLVVGAMALVGSVVVSFLSPLRSARTLPEPRTDAPGRVEPGSSPRS